MKQIYSFKKYHEMDKAVMLQNCKLVNIRCQKPCFCFPSLLNRLRMYICCISFISPSDFLLWFWGPVLWTSSALKHLYIYIYIYHDTCSITITTNEILHGSNLFLNTDGLPTTEFNWLKHNSWNNLLHNWQLILK